jgi:hypothetical protein
MTVPFVLVADFIEKLTNPSYGTATNETYAARLATELDASPEFAGEFANRPLVPADVPMLSLGGWLWYLVWRRQRNDARPDNEFLDALFDVSAEPIVRFHVVQESVSTRPEAPADRPTSRQALDDRPVGHEEHTDDRREPPSSWLDERISRILNADQPLTDTIAEAQELALYLLQLGDRVSRAALASMLRESWPGRSGVVELVENVVGALGRDDPAQREWRRSLGLPNH